MVQETVIAILKLAVFMLLELLDDVSWPDCKWKVIELVFVFCVQLGRNFCHCHNALLEDSKTSIILYCQNVKSSVDHYLVSIFCIKLHP